MRKILYIAPLTVLMVGGLASVAAAQTTATATYEVQAINEVSVSGNPAALVINTGAELAGVTDATTTWGVTTNETGKKVTGAINTAMPTGVTLEVSLAAPSGATSAGSKALGIAAVDLVTGIAQVQATGLGVTYTLKSTPTAGVVASATKTVTYTITAAV